MTVDVTNHFSLKNFYNFHLLHTFFFLYLTLIHRPVVWPQFWNFKKLFCKWMNLNAETILFEFWIQRSQYIRPKVTLHKCAETIQGRKLFNMRKYSVQKWNYIWVIRIFWFYLSDLFCEKSFKFDTKTQIFDIFRSWNQIK